MTKDEVDLIYDYLHKTYHYKEDGHLINNKTNKVVHGSICGNTKKLLFIFNFRLNGKKYHWSYGHVIYLYHNKIKPSYLIHINGNPSDNRIENLKASNLSEMMINSNLSVKNKHGYKGVIKDNKRYGARLWTGKTYKYLGWFNTPEEAHALYLKAKAEK